MNSYNFVLENNFPISWQSFIELIFHIASSKLSESEQKKELKKIEDKAIQWYSSEEMINQFRALITIRAFQKKYPMDKLSFMLDELFNCHQN